MGCHFFLQVTFLIHGSYPSLLHLLHWKVGSLTLAPPWPERSVTGKQKALFLTPASCFTTNCDPGQRGLSPCKMVRAMPPCPIHRLMKWSKELIKDKALYRLLKHILQKVLLWQRFRAPVFPSGQWCVCLIMAYSLQPVVCSPPDFSVHGILQATILEWDPLLQGSSRPRDCICVSCISCISRLILYHWATGKAWESPNFWLADAEGIMGHASVWCSLSKVISQWDMYSS